jgi:alkaline phosphatase D
MDGEVRVVYFTKPDRSDAKETPWTRVSAERDYTAQFQLTGLKPATKYSFEAQTRPVGGKLHASLSGSFTTAPSKDTPRPVVFTVITGQAYKDVDHADGFHIYESMVKLQPQFLVPTGDTVYYDSEDPRAVTVGLARYHWHRMYSYPRHVAFHRSVPGYWEKDDHDVYANDCWPSMKPNMLPLTFADGQRIFREQVPMGEKTYRTFRWGKDLQVWLVEGRDFRSPNNMKDGPEKTIWGAEQMKWLKETLLASDASFKVLISPTPIVGPDRGAKADNHANKAFSNEGDAFRSWAQKNLSESFFLCCGDRHWQYHSVHPETKLHEFSCGPASDQHAGGSPGLDKEYHRFHRVNGGFLSVAVSRVDGKPRILFRFHDVLGKELYRFESARPGDGGAR